jgi:cell division protein FtsL
LQDVVNDIPGVRRATEALQEGLFLRGNLADAVKKRDFRRTAWSLGLLSVVLFAYVWAHMAAVRLGYQVQELKAEKRRLTNEYYFLRYKISEVRSLGRVEQEARTRLGMVTPRTDQVVILSEKGLGGPLWMQAWRGKP